MGQQRVFFGILFVAIGLLAFMVMLPFFTYIVLAAILTYTLFPVYDFSLRRTKRAARAPCQWVALAEGVQDLAANTASRIRSERGAAVTAVATGCLHEPDETPRDEVLAVGAAAAWVDRTRGDRSRELEVRDDAVISDNKSRIGHKLPRAADRTQPSPWCQ